MVNYTEEKQIPIDSEGWNTITDAMAEVVNPGGTAPSAHLNGIDFAGKTGSSQTISNAMKAKVANKSAFKDNGWFVGVTPRRNPEIVVVVLVEGGEHGYLSARIAAQVVRAYVDKQRARQVNVAADSGKEAKPDRTPEAAGAETAKPEPTKPAPATTAKPKPAEMTGMWGGTSGELHGARFRISEAVKFHPAAAAPGMEALAEHAAQLAAGASHSPGESTREWESLPSVFAIVESPARSDSRR
jgi:penicillin-binding protein 2